MNDRVAARRLVVVSVLVMLGAVIVKAARGQVGQTFPRLWALSVIAVVLAMVADFAPQIAGPLALLIALSYLNDGTRKAFADTVNKGLGGKGGKLAAGIGGQVN